VSLALSLTLAISSLLYAANAGASTAAQSATVIGGNSLLSEGADALEAGRFEEGVRLTLAGLKESADLHDIAAGHANVCAGLVQLQQLDAALEHCNLAIEMDSTNWRAFNNRAAVYVAKGLFEQAFRDIKSGLELAPNSSTLHESLRVAQRNKRIMERRGRHAVPS
jgi:tetratricopeptide (TPR) repeat protein